MLEWSKKTWAVEILMYLDRHGETKQEILKMKICSSGETLRDRLDTLAGYELITGYRRECDDSHHIANHWDITDKGALALEKLREADRIVRYGIPELKE